MIWLNRRLFHQSILALAETLSIALFLSDFASGSWSLHVWNIAIAGGLVLLGGGKASTQAKFHIKTFLAFWLLSIFHQSVIWGIKTFPLDDPQLVILILRMPLDGFTLIFAKSFILKVLLSCFITSFFISILIEPWIITKKKKVIFFGALFFIFTGINVLTICINIPVHLYKEHLRKDDIILQESKFFQEKYTNIDTVTISNDFETTKNLILILMESIENSFVDSASGGIQQTNLIPELMPSDSNEYHFSNSGLIGGGFNSEGANATISATIAKTTGCPLLLRKNLSDTLLEKVTSDYDILQKYGYQNVFIQGTDAVFSGTKNFLLSHGINTLYDMHSLEKMQDMDNRFRKFRSFDAGITDRTILDISKHILDTLSKKTHFTLTIATIETHYPYGFYNKACEDKPQNITEQASLEATIKCASKDMRNFINWVKQQPFYSNTEIVILGDHLFMGDYLVNKNTKDRRWYNLFINPIIKPETTKREFTSFDIAPTILESLGFTIDNHKMGFGTSLFSSESTLVEKIGIDSLNKELMDFKNSIEYNDISYPASINQIRDVLHPSKTIK